MANYRAQICAAIIISISAALGLCSSAWGQSSAQSDSSELIRALQDRGKTRSFSPGGTRNESDRTEKRKKVIEALRRREKTRGLSVDERPYADERPSLAVTDEQDFSKEYTDAKEDRPFAEIVIYFDYNSAVIRSRSRPDLASLGRALMSRQLRDKTFVVEGHTDAKGGDDYNQMLSERRALAVKRYLVDYLGVPDNLLTIIGRGETELKLPNQPYDAQNRRVQVINFGRVADAD